MDSERFFILLHLQIETNIPDSQTLKPEIFLNI